MEEQARRRVVNLAGQPHGSGALGKLYGLGLQRGIIVLAVVCLGLHHVVLSTAVWELEAQGRLCCLGRCGRKGDREVPGASG